MKIHPTARGKLITPNRYNGFKTVQYACVEYQAMSDGRVTAELIDQNGRYCGRSVVADCRNETSAKRYADQKNQEVTQ